MAKKGYKCKTTKDPRYKAMENRSFMDGKSKGCKK